MRTFKIHAIPDWQDAPQSHITFALVIEDDAGKHGTAVVTRGWLTRFRPMVGGYVSFSGVGLTGGTYSPIAPAKLALWGEEDGEKVPELAPKAAYQAMAEATVRERRPTAAPPLTTEERTLVRDLRNECTALKRNLDNATKERDAARAQRNPELGSIEQYQLQMAAICTAAIGYWKLGQPIHADYDTPALQDVAALYARYQEVRNKLEAASDRANVDATLLRQATERADRLQAEYDALKATRQFHDTTAIQAKLDRAERALLRAGFQDLGGQEWKPAPGKPPVFVSALAPATLAVLSEFIDKYCLDDSRLIACAESAFHAFNKAMAANIGSNEQTRGISIPAAEISGEAPLIKGELGEIDGRVVIVPSDNRDWMAALSGEQASYEKSIESKLHLAGQRFCDPYGCKHCDADQLAVTAEEDEAFGHMPETLRIKSGIRFEPSAFAPHPGVLKRFNEFCAKENAEYIKSLSEPSGFLRWAYVEEPAQEPDDIGKLAKRIKKLARRVKALEGCQ